jgi:hypothetical protein
MLMDHHGTNGVPHCTEFLYLCCLQKEHVLPLLIAMAVGAAGTLPAMRRLAHAGE